MNLAIPIASLVALVVAIICMGLAVYHFAGMIRGVRSSSEWWVNLIPFIAFAFSSALDGSGLIHRAKFFRWISLACALALAALALQYVAGRA